MIFMKNKIMACLIIFVFLLFLYGCFQVRGSELNTTPVTNNPNIVPKHNQFIPATH